MNNFEKNKNFENSLLELSLKDDFFKKIDDFFLEYQAEEKLKSSLIEVVENLKRSAFRYTESVLESLRSNEQILNGVDVRKERSDLQSERAFFDEMQRLSHKSLEIDFSVLGRILKKTGKNVSWLDPNTNNIKEPNKAKLVSLKYILNLALNNRELIEKESKTEEDEKRLKEILSIFDVDDIKKIIEKFDRMSKFYQDDFLINLGINKKN